MKPLRRARQMCEVSALLPRVSSGDTSSMRSLPRSAKRVAAVVTFGFPHRAAVTPAGAASGWVGRLEPTPATASSDLFC